jgi:plastocyanin
MALLLAACEYPGVPHPQAAGEGTDGEPTETPTAATPVGTPGTAPTETTTEEPEGPPALEGTVEIALKDFELVPDELTVKAGEVTFVLPNEGRYTHDFLIEGEGVELNAGKVGARRSMEWEVTLEPGEYRILCRISNHDERGMLGTMTVVP